MVLIRSLPISLTLLLLEYALLVRSVYSSNAFSRVVQHTHQIAARHTRNIARDLRLAFGAVLVSDPSQQPLDDGRAVYCKSSAAAGNGGQGNNSSSPTGTNSQGTGTSTNSAAVGSPTTSAVSTPWKLIEAHVGRRDSEQTAGSHLFSFL